MLSEKKKDIEKLIVRSTRGRRNQTQMKSSQVDGSDSDSSVVLFTITIPTVFYLAVSEWILDTGATYHVCPKQD